MFENKPELWRPVDNPFESLYRPWSWLLSSFSNVAIFAILFLIGYALVRRARSRGKKKTLYRKVVVKEEEVADNGKVRALVTGGSGCLGRALVHNLLQDGGYAVYSLDLVIPSEDARHPEVTAYLQLDIVDRDELEILLNDISPQVVFHVAGIIPTLGADMYAVNTTGTMNVVEVCKQAGVKRLLYTSTASVLISRNSKQVLDLADEDTPIPEHPIGSYTDSKAKAEKIILAANGSEQLVTCVLRPDTIAHIDSILCRNLLQGSGFYIGSGSNKMSIVPAGACAKGHILAEKKLREGIKSAAAGRIYNLCGEPVVYSDLIGYVPDKSTGISIWEHPPPKSLPKWFALCLSMINKLLYFTTGWYLSLYLTREIVVYCTRAYTFDSTRAHRELGWEELPSWQQIIKDLVKEYKQLQEKNKDHKYRPASFFLN